MNANTPANVLPINLPKFDRCGALIEYYDDGIGNLGEVHTDILPMSQDHYMSESNVSRFYKNLESDNHNYDYSLPALD